MPWVKFTENYNWSPTTSMTYAYKKGMVELVTTPCANAAIERGRAEKTTKPKGEVNASRKS